MTKQRSLRPAELAEMEAGFTKWLNMEDIGHDKYGAFIAGYMLGRMSELPPDEPSAPQEKFPGAARNAEEMRIYQAGYDHGFRDGEQTASPNRTPDP